MQCHPLLMAYDCLSSLLHNSIFDGNSFVEYFLQLFNCVYNGRNLKLGPITSWWLLNEPKINWRRTTCIRMHKNEHETVTWWKWNDWLKTWNRFYRASFVAGCQWHHKKCLFPLTRTTEKNTNWRKEFAFVMCSSVHAPEFIDLSSALVGSALDNNIVCLSFSQPRPLLCDSIIICYLTFNSFSFLLVRTHFVRWACVVSIRTTNSLWNAIHWVKCEYF